jgi:hypothetical protein
VESGSGPCTQPAPCARALMCAMGQASASGVGVRPVHAASALRASTHVCYVSSECEWSWGKASEVLDLVARKSLLMIFFNSKNSYSIWF